MITTYDVVRARALQKPEQPLARYRRAHGWTTVSTAEAVEQAGRVAGGLAARGVEAGDRVAILAENRWEWLLTDLALRHLGAVTVGLYPTDYIPNWVEILRNSAARALLVSSSLAAHADRLAREAGVPLVVAYDEPATGQVPFAELLAAAPCPPATLREDDVATLVYTSGTTGRPKGATLTHGNVTSNCEGALAYFSIGANDHYLSFLPLSHAFERTALTSFVRGGSCVYFGRGIHEVVADLKEVAPTIVCTVPRVLEKVVARVQESLGAAPAAKRVAFRALSGINAIFGESGGDWRAELRRRVGETFFHDIHAIFGGRLRFIVSGGARLAPEVTSFFTRVGITVYEGYGITECSPIVAACHGRFTRVGTVGEPFPGLEVKIADDDEILVRGASVMRGYWLDEAGTREVIDADGFFHTGDLGSLGEDGLLSIHRRKKEILVTSGGKNIAPVHIEAELQKSPLVSQACAIGDGRNFVAALLVPNLEVLAQRLRAEGETLPPPAQLPSFAPALALLQREVDSCNQRLAHYESVRRFALVPEEFAIDNGLLTPTLKMKRGPIAERYAAVIDGLYAGGPARV
jgi:long-chain acyl-CoA synthetase